MIIVHIYQKDKKIFFFLFSFFYYYSMTKSRTIIKFLKTFLIHVLLSGVYNLNYHEWLAIYIMRLCVVHMFKQTYCNITIQIFLFIYLFIIDYKGVENLIEKQVTI